MVWLYHYAWVLALSIVIGGNDFRGKIIYTTKPIGSLEYFMILYCLVIVISQYSYCRYDVQQSLTDIYILYIVPFSNLDRANEITFTHINFTKWYQSTQNFNPSCISYRCWIITYRYHEIRKLSLYYWGPNIYNILSILISQ